MALLRAALVNLHVGLSTLGDWRFYALSADWLLRRCLPLPDAPPPAASLPREDAWPQVPVDLVYLWVDGADPAHAARRAAVTGNAVALDARLFTDHNELKLSLRSVERFLPWVRHIHIVTDRQVPAWLEVRHPKIRLHDHRDLFLDASCLPVFNSAAIEFQLWRIPGLSEHFLYANDDNFFGRPCSKDDFFVFSEQGGEITSKLRLGHYMYILPSVLEYALGDRLTALWIHSLNNLRSFLELRYPLRRIRQTFLHQAAPLKKSQMERLVARWPHLYEASGRNRLRSINDIPPVQLCSHLAVIEGEAVIDPVSHRYFSTLAAFAACANGGGLPKLCCINQLTEAVDVCDPALAIDFCRAPSAFEKR
jgi:hypothetical protein